MNIYKKTLCTIYIALYAAGIWIVYMDINTWRKADPSGAQIQAKAQLKGARP